MLVQRAFVLWREPRAGKGGGVRTIRGTEIRGLIQLSGSKAKACDMPKEPIQNCSPTCEHAGRRREVNGQGQGIQRFGEWYTGTEADLERDLAELAAHKEAARSASGAGTAPLPCAPFSDHRPGQVGLMLRPRKFVLT